MINTIISKLKNLEKNDNFLEKKFTKIIQKMKNLNRNIIIKGNKSAFQKSVFQKNVDSPQLTMVQQGFSALQW